MIAARNTPGYPEVRIPAVAREAIRRGIRRGDAVAQLEYLGFSPRYMNLLENSRMNIISLAQLMARSRGELLEIPGFGESALHQLMDCLSRYHQLEATIEHQEAHDRRMAEAARTFQGFDE
jgi:hypothetical protein